MQRFNGLIHHAFALENHCKRRAFRGHNVEAIVQERFAPPGFEAGPFPPVRDAPERSGSALFAQGFTTLDPRARLKYLKHGPEGYEHELPDAFSWANAGKEATAEEEDRHWERLIFARKEVAGEVSYNDFLVTADRQGADPPAQAVSEILCELLGARRSMLFGLALANRFVNVMLPHAMLAPATESEFEPAAAWILQPLVSLVRVGREGLDFRRMYSLSFFLIPVRDSDCEERQMPEAEIERIVNAGWGLSAAPTGLPEFDLDGPLRDYVLRLAPEAEAGWERLTLRKATEMVTFAVALRMAQGSTGQARGRVKEEIGDEVVSAFGNSRVSSVLFAAGLDKENLDSALSAEASPNPLEPMMRTLAGKVRVPPLESTRGREHRLDRSYIDHDDYAIGVLPSNRCLVVVSDQRSQFGRWDSGLMQAVWFAYTVIGAAGAIGTMRAINRDLEVVDRSNPTKIAEIEHEVAVDLHEIYDLDITWEAFRLRYRRLRGQLGITSDYEALRGKLEALYRETNAHFEAKSQWRLIVLTAAIVALSVLILVGTIVLALKPK